VARIPDDELEKLKTTVDLVRLVEARGVQLTKKGADLVGCCPFHEDDTPSFVVTPHKNLWHCFGGCQAKGGDVIQFVMKAEGVSFRHAVELLRAGADVSGPVVKVGTVRKLPPVVKAGSDDATLLADVVDHYHRTLLLTPAALAYVEKRGLSRECVEHFKLGFSDRSLGLHLPAKNRAQGEELRARLTTLGVLRETGHEHLRGSLVVPIVDVDGVVAGMYGRKIRDDLRAGTPPHLYLPGPHRGVFNVDGFKDYRDVILCESLIDALTFWSAGLHHVTTSYGTSGFTDELLSTLMASSVERVLIAYDRDDAGDQAAAELVPRLLAAGFSVSRIQFPRGMDANEYALKVQPAEKALRLIVDKAAFISQGTRKSSPAPAMVALEAEAAKGEAAESPPLAASPSTTTTAPIPTAPPTVSTTTKPPAPTPAAPPAAQSSMQVESLGLDELVAVVEDRRWRVRGIHKNLSHEVLKVNVRVSRGDAVYVETVDLFSRQRFTFAKHAAHELRVDEEVLKKDLGRLLIVVGDQNDEAIRGTLSTSSSEAPPMDADEMSEALAFLRAPDLLDQVLADFERCGIVGEEINKLVGYLGSVSRKLDDPLAIVIQSSTAAGKSSLMEAVLSFVPDEDKVKYSSMTGQSLFYMNDVDLKHKVLALVEEEGAKRASYSLKLLQSEKELTIASTGKDPATGKLTTHEYRVEGPVMLMMTTTAAEIDEELMNRCLVLSVNEERTQTAAIHALQRRRQTIEGMLEKHERQAIVQKHQNAQRLLEPLLVANPWAEKLTFLDDKTRTRRDHGKYLTLIRVVALLHQHQRTLKTTTHRGRTVRYIEATLDDVAVAHRLAHECLGRSLDELSPQTRRILEAVDRMVTEKARADDVERPQVRFSRRDVLAVAGVSLTQLQLHLGRLVDHELVVLHRQTHGLGFVYELAWNGEGRDGRPFLPGLVDVDSLRPATTTTDLSGVKGGGVGGLPGVNRPEVGPVSGRNRRPVVEVKSPPRPRNSTSGAHAPLDHTHEQAAE
jgi:DNA primase catalytic core